MVAAGGSLDEAIATKAREDNIPVNVVDRGELSTFVFPPRSIGEVVVAIGTGGASPVLARYCANASRRRCRRASAISPP